MMRRREFITLLGGAAAAWPLAARAQQASMPVVGFLRSTAMSGAAHLVTAFRQGLNETGFVEGQSVVIDYRWGDNQIDRLPGLVAEMVRRRAAVIVAGAQARSLCETPSGGTDGLPRGFCSAGPEPDLRPRPPRRGTDDHSHAWVPGQRTPVRPSVSLPLAAAPGRAV